MRRAATIVLIVLGSIVGLMVVAVVAWAVDTQSHDGQVVRNVHLAGRGVGGLNRAQLTKMVEGLAQRYRGAPVEIDASEGGIRSDTTELGIELQVNATVQAVMDVGRHGSLGGRVGSWLGGFFGDRDAPLRVQVNPDAVYQAVATKDPERIPPDEPSLRVEKGRLRPVAGEPGLGIDPADVLAALPEAAEDGLPIRIEVDRGAVPPRFQLAHATALVAEGERLTETSLEIAAGDATAKASTAQMRSWLRAVPSGGELRLSVDGRAAAADLGKLLPQAGEPATETEFRVVDGAVQIIAGKPGTACCSDGAGSVVERALRNRPPAGQPVRMPLRRVDPELTVDQAAALGIKEQVGTFSTAHKGGEPRVRNIHRIADLLRGQVIKPGKTFSVNNFVGKRTAARGFVTAPVIEDGKFEESVGGGISQFATTMFNAAFFAGLEFAEYQSHSIYISRYPYGREATLSYPKPDLVIRNPTPYGVLIWPTYSETRIIVSLYSTKWADAQQTGQTREPKGACTRVRTERTRSLLDGSKKVDHVSALYRPGEGVNC